MIYIKDTLDDLIFGPLDEDQAREVAEYLERQGSVEDYSSFDVMSGDMKEQAWDLLESGKFGRFEKLTEEDVSTEDPDMIRSYYDFLAEKSAVEPKQTLLGRNRWRKLIAKKKDEKKNMLENLRKTRRIIAELGYCVKCSYGFGFGEKAYGPYQEDKPCPQCGYEAKAAIGEKGQEELGTAPAGFGEKYYVDANMAFDDPDTAPMAGPFYDKAEAQEFADDVEKLVIKKHITYAPKRVREFFKQQIDDKSEEGVDQAMHDARKEELPSVYPEKYLRDWDIIADIIQPSKFKEKLKEETDKRIKEYYEEQPHPQDTNVATSRRRKLAAKSNKDKKDDKEKKPKRKGTCCCGKTDCPCMKAGTPCSATCMCMSKAKKEKKKKDAQNLLKQIRQAKALLKIAKGKCEDGGCIEQDSSGNWRVISNKTGKYWPAKYESKEKAQAALRGYHANK